MLRRCQTRVQPRWRQPTGRKKRWRRMKHGRTVLGWETKACRQWMDEGHGVRAIDTSARAQTFSPCRCASATDDAGLRQARSPRRSGARRRRVGEKTGALARGPWPHGNGTSAGRLLSCLAAAVLPARPEAGGDRLAGVTARVYRPSRCAHHVVEADSTMACCCSATVMIRTKEKKRSLS